MNHPLYKYHLREIAVGEVRMFKDRPGLSRYLTERGREMDRVFRTKRIGDERRVKRVA